LARSLTLRLFQITATFMNRVHKDYSLHALKEAQLTALRL